MNREDLKKYRYNKIWIEEQIELYQEMKQRAEGLRTSVIDGMPKAQNKPNYVLENLIDQYNYILEKLGEDQKIQNKILLQLQKVEEPYRSILTKYYVQGKKLVRVADEMNYEYEYVKHLNGTALNKFDEIGE